MKQIVLFEIPIYTMKKEVFDRKWNIKKNILISKFISSGHTDENAKQGIHELLYPADQWKYNQIIGYIVVSISQDTVFFDIYKSFDKKYYAVSKTKHFIQNSELLGDHFYCEGKSNQLIRSMICKNINELKKNILERFYVDDSTFNNIIKYIDIVSIKDTIKNTID